MHVSISDLFLAFRQAKAFLFFEKRGVGLVELAKYEENLAANLIDLQSRLEKGDGWFSDVKLGQVWVVPKRQRTVDVRHDAVLIIGGKKNDEDKRGLEVSIRITPSPDFAIIEILYLWRFGPMLDALVPKEAVGYRLDLRNGEIRKSARWVFEYWPKRYNEFRREGLSEARRALTETTDPIDLISADLASFYDTVDASFLVSANFLDLLFQTQNPDQQEFIADFQRATQSLIVIHRKFHRKVRYFTGLPWQIGVPIGSLTSRLIANVALATLDESILRHPDILSYKRYVDDIVIVGRSGGKFDLNKIDSVMRHYVPLSTVSNEKFELDVTALDRPGSTFMLQREKCRAYRLEGHEGRDFLSAIAADFQHLVSERRAFLDNSVFDLNEARRIIRAGKDTASPVRSLRDADRVKLEHFALSTTLSSIERVSLLVENNDARQLVRSALEGLERLVADQDSWVESVESAFRLLSISVSIEEWEGVSRLLNRMDAIWGDLEAVQHSVSGIFYRGFRVKNRRAMIRLRNYLHEAKLEAVCGSIGPIDDTSELPVHLREGFTYRTQTLGSTTLENLARMLAVTNLRALDREDDHQLRGSFKSPNRAFLDGIQFDDELTGRLNKIAVFVEKAKKMADPIWDLEPARLFLSTRPPSYFDISRRWLYQIEQAGVHEGLFEELLVLVNAIRGTNYQDPVGIVLSEANSELSVPVVSHDQKSRDKQDPRLILGNLTVSENAFQASLSKAPIVNLARLQGLATVLAKAASVAREAESVRDSLLVLPELSLPRAWFRTVANYVVKQGSYGLVVGLEYLHHVSKPYVYNQACIVLPGAYSAVATWPWTKQRPACEEQTHLDRAGLSFSPPSVTARRQTIVSTPWGILSVLICSEFLEVRKVSDLLRRVELLVVPSWNIDTSSFGHLIQTTGMQLHAVIAIANNGTYSDCRAWAPKSKRWARDLCRLIERGVDDIVYVDIPLASLQKFHASPREINNKSKPESEQGPDWRPLPPDWTQ